VKDLKDEDIYDVVIIGAGVAGFAAAMYAGRFMMKTLVIGETPGGTIILTDVTENYPGFKRLTGMELADKIREHAMEYGVKLIEDRVLKVEREGGECFKVETSENSYRGKTVIFATGTKARKLNVPGEEKFSNKGVHYCALCDGFFYKEKVIGVVGGSDSAAKEALLLSQYGRKVYIIYRGKKIHPEPINQKRVEENPKIEVINNTQVLEMKGKDRLEALILNKPYEGNKELPIDAVFITIGHIPLSQLAVNIGVETNSKGEIKIDRLSKTNVPGVYAAGDVTDSIFKQAITGVAEGVTAAYSAYQFVSEAEVTCYKED
jgi:thioredoxin reductase (NADPH)